MLNLCEVPPTAVTTSVTPTPTSTSRINLSIVSLVILFLTSSTITSPIGIVLAKETAGSGSDIGVSLST